LSGCERSLRHQPQRIESGFSGVGETGSRSKPRYWTPSQIINNFHIYWFALISSDVASACTFGSDNTRDGGTEAQATE
jgi:hypothetical protein